MSGWLLGVDESSQVGGARRSVFHFWTSDLRRRGWESLLLRPNLTRNRLHLSSCKYSEELFCFLGFPALIPPPSCQVMESLLIALVDLSPLLLPRLAANPGTHLGRLLDLVGEVTEGMQEQVCVRLDGEVPSRECGGGGSSLFYHRVMP